MDEIKSIQGIDNYVPFKADNLPPRGATQLINVIGYRLYPINIIFWMTKLTIKSIHFTDVA